MKNYSQGEKWQSFNDKNCKIKFYWNQSSLKTEMIPFDGFLIKTLINAESSNDQNFHSEE